MPEKSEHFDENRHSPEISDDAIRGFLLGQLESSDQSDFEERLFSDVELEARVRLAELDLTDDYVFKSLTCADRERFHRNFLLSTDRKRALEVSRALHERFASASLFESKAAIAQRLRTLFDFKQSAWRYAFAALILLIVLASVWLVIKEPQLAKRFMPPRALPRPAATSTPQETHHPSSSSSPVHAEQSPPMPAHRPPTLTVVLDPKSTIENAVLVSLPQTDVDVVHFQLTIDKNQSGIYRADLLSITGESVFSAESLKSESNEGLINLDVPASALRIGAYQINLNRVDVGSKPGVATYY